MYRILTLDIAVFGWRSGLAYRCGEAVYLLEFLVVKKAALRSALLV